MPQQGQRNMTVLNVAEKNDAAKEIARAMSLGHFQRREGFSKFNKIYEYNSNILNSNCKMIMTSVSGHLLDLEFGGIYRSWQGCPPSALFNAPVERFCPEKFNNIKRTLEREIRKCQTLIIWTDGDREGENIGFEIIEVCKNVKQNIQVYRAKFSEITQQSIARACRNLIPPDANVSNAVEVRRELDLRIGAAFTRFQTLRLQKRFPEVLSQQLISYGSCQFPTLGFVVERYQQIQNFISEPFYKIKVIHSKDNERVEFSWERGRLFHERVCRMFHNMCLQRPQATVVSVTSRPKSKWRPVALDTVELEKTVSRKLKISAKQTMGIAEKLYTQGFISYPRTETNIFPKDLDLITLVQNQTEDANWGAFAANILGHGVNPRNGKKTDNAHPPIHPIKYTSTLQGNEKRIYEFIVRHFLACLSQDAKGQETTVTITVADEMFSANGLVILERNYLNVYPFDYWSAKTIPSYNEGSVFQPDDIEFVTGETRPPSLLTEADLIALMEKHGIGTDATHAEHIETIKNRNYVGEQPDRTLVPGELGMGLVQGYDSMGFEMSKPHLRAELENDLKCICEGRKQKDVVLAEQIQKYKEVFGKASEKVAKLDEALSTYFGAPTQVAPGDLAGPNLDVSEPVRKCPKCGRYDMVIRKTKENSFMLGCQGFPGCKNGTFFPKFVLEANRSQATCRQCPGPVHQIEFTFKRGSVPPMMPLKYSSCIQCDRELIELIGTGAGDNRIANAVAPERGNQQPRAPAQQTRARADVPQERNPLLPNNGNRGNRGDRPSRGSNGANNNNNDHRPDSDGNGVACDCSKPAILLTVRKDGPNQGRQFYKCGNDSTCKFFVWADEASNSNQRPINAGNSKNPRPTAPSNATFAAAANRTITNISFMGTPTMRPSSDENSVVCSCGKPALQLTVRKDGPNQGRQFYKCADDNKCKFFLWADEGPGNNNTAQTGAARNFGSSANSSRSNDEAKCNCNQDAVSRIVNKDGPNKGRSFFACAKPKGQSCSYFQWADEDNNNNNNQSSTWRGGSARGRGSARGGYANTGQKRSRKCGSCGEQGHTKKTCPYNR